MSYILDALKKAESERQSGSIPNVHAQPTAPEPSESGRSAWVRPASWAALTAAVMALGGLAWVRTGMGVSAVVPMRAAPAALPSVQASTVSAVPAQPPLEEAAASAAVEPTVAAALNIMPKSAPAAVRVVSPEPLPVGGPAAPKPMNRVLTLRELPEQIQKAIPEITIGAYIYSDIPAERVLLVNRESYREGDEVAPGLTLEKVLPGEAVFSYMGYRYRVSY